MAFPKGKRLAGRKGFHKRAKFSSSRLRSSESPEDDAQQEKQQDLSEEYSEESEEEAPQQMATPYQRLLQSFKINLDKEERPRKRRKVEPKTADSAILESEPDRISEADELDDHSDPEPEAADESASEGDHTLADPFDVHFANTDAALLEKRIDAISKGWSSQRVSFGNEKCTLLTPQGVNDNVSTAIHTRKTISLETVKKRLSGVWDRASKKLEHTEKTLFEYILNYNDIFFAGRTPKNASNLREMVSLHTLNHILKTRDKVLKHNARLANEKRNPNLEFKDQGFTRPKVLFILPTRGSCARIVETLVSLFEPEQQENRKRFEDNYVDQDGKVPFERPDDFKELFEGNDDDMFRVGVKFTRKTIKFFAQFYNSDIILASPLGLRRAIESNESKPDHDYLSSIEVLVIDQADALLMQNIDHLTFILEHLNLIPKESHGCDFSRVREWYLDGNSKYLRQTIMLSAYITPELNALCTRFMLNQAGKLKYQPTYNASMLATNLPIKQIFNRFQSSSFKADPDARFAHFTSTIIPWILKSPKSADGTLGMVIFIPSYFDYVRVRNYFSMNTAVSSLSWASITENKGPADRETLRARSHFLSGRHDVLLYTGRAHHFYRFIIRGVRSVVFYQLPENPLFYREMVSGWLGANVASGRMSGEEGRVRALFSKWDGLSLERIVGSDRVGRMISGTGETFEFS